MSASEEDIQASAAVTNLKPKSLLEDTAHHFTARTVLEVKGDLSALNAVAIGSVPAKGGKPAFLSLLTKDGYLDADLFLVPYAGGTLVDVHGELAEDVAERLSQLDGVTEVDPTAGERWRIFGELPDQKNVETQFETIRFADTRRRELGARVLREAAEPEGFDWRHFRKWDGHAMRLGLLPDHRCVIGKQITPEEAGYHRLLAKPSQSDGPPPERRILPMRIEPSGNAMPAMTGASIIAGDVSIGTVLEHEGVCALALVTIAPWREALANRAKITCMDEQALLIWPTWLATESQGHFGPAPHLI
ncbi:MAG: hypothetical protein AAFZ11_05225 [Pseudomonadota bacterium]